MMHFLEVEVSNEPEFIVAILFRKTFTDSLNI